MSSDRDLFDLYSQRILALAADIPHLGRLPAPDGTAQVRAPLCGSALRADVALSAGRVAAYAQDVKACALGQAAAAVVGAQIIGRSRAELQTARDELAAMLKQAGPAPSAPFEDLSVLAAARDYPNRHGSILLALDAPLAAIDAALDAAGQAACA